jgi:hypothetical protein
MANNHIVVALLIKIVIISVCAVVYFATYGSVQSGPARFHAECTDAGGVAIRISIMPSGMRQNVCINTSIIIDLENR